MNSTISFKMHPISPKKYLLIIFVVLALFIRIIFWIFTNRIWEDALITLVPALNFWDGMGLTHHPSEPFVHSFTSPISVLIPLVGIPLMDGIDFLRLASLLCTALSIYYANEIADYFDFKTLPRAAFLSYLSFDQLQIFFGMSGMETQIAVAVMLSIVYFFLVKKYRALGFVSGIALITRPEFFLVISLMALYFLIYERGALKGFSLRLLLFSLPWFLFAQIYYGSIIPNTILAKSMGGTVGFLKGDAAQYFRYFIDSWAHIAPFKEFWFVEKAPVPLFFIKIFMAIVFIWFLLGSIKSMLENNIRLIFILLILIFFIAYRIFCLINTYYMWYLPPFAAIFFLFVSYGLNTTFKFSLYNKLASGCALLLIIGYASHIPFSFYVARDVQEIVENGVRKQVGNVMNSYMTSSDSVVLEPLGYIGYGIRGKTTWDIPGLSSPKVVKFIRATHETSPGGVIEGLLPNYGVLRPNEYEDFLKRSPQITSRYSKFDVVEIPKPKLEYFGYKEFTGDNSFIIIKRVD